MFFRKFKTIPYELDGYSKEAMNIITASVVKHFNVDKSFVYQRYVVQAGASPESLAYDLYGDADKYWTILFVNGIVDPFVDWPMEPDVLEKWVEAKYGDVNKIIDFRDVTTGDLLDDVAKKDMFDLIEDGQPIPNNISPITALAHEMEINQRKGEIVVIVPRYINNFIDMFNRSIEGKV